MFPAVVQCSGGKGGLRKTEANSRKVLLGVALGQHLGNSPLRGEYTPCLTFHVCAAQVEVRDALGKLIDIAYHVR